MTGYRKTFISTRVFKLDTFEQTLQLGKAQTLFLLAIVVEYKLTLFKSFAPDDVTIAIKEQDFHLRSSSVNENIEMAIERILMQSVFY